MYKPTDVFLNSDDCDKIAPYIPNEILKGWEWWHVQPYGCAAEISIVRFCYEDYAKVLDVNKRVVPALDVGILGEILTRHSDIVEFDCISAGIIIQYRTSEGHHWYFDDKPELQNRRDALMYLIDQKLISPVEGREK